jgi:hypothetical protein
MNDQACDVAQAGAVVSELIELAEAYAALEMRVNRLMRAACSGICGACCRVCCRAEMCRESLESPFLVLLREQGNNKPAWDDDRGWLGSRGCALTVGRPPVCYEFICPDILEAQPSQAAQARLQELAMLLTQAGRRAIGGDHLVEIMTTERLALVKPRRMAARIGSAGAKLVELEYFWGGMKAHKS